MRSSSSSTIASRPVGSWWSSTDPNPRSPRVVDEFRSRRGPAGPITRVGRSGAAWRRSSDATVAATPSDAPGRVADRAPLVAAAPTDAIDLSVVVVFYDMAREAARTLHSLSRSYQEGLDDLEYEVIVVDNGSHPEQRLDAAFVESFGPEFRFLDLHDDARPSPTRRAEPGGGARAAAGPSRS